MKRIRTLLPCFVLSVALLFPGVAGAQVDWKADYATASDVAKRDKTDIFVLVTGTDWSKQSRDYRAKLLSSPGLANLKSKFVFVEIDKPDLPTPEQKEAAKKNEGFKILPRSFPGVALLDSEGRSWFAAGNLKGTPDELFKRIDAALKVKVERDKYLERAEKSDGIEKAKALAAALELMERQDFSTYPAHGQHNHRGLLKEIKKLDPEDTIGVVRRLEFNLGAFMERQVDPLLREKKYAEARELVDKELADPRNDARLKQHFLAYRFRCYQAEENLDEAVKTLREIVRLDARSKMGFIADGYIDFNIKPIILKNGRYSGFELRPFYGDLRLDVTKIIKDAGVYEAVITRDDGGDVRVRDVSLQVGDITKDKSRSREIVKTEGSHTVRGKELVVPLTVSSVPQEPIWLCVPMQGTGWFGGHGRIELRKGK